MITCRLTSRGLVQNKETWLKNYFIPLAELIKAGKFRWETYDLKDLEIRIHGDTGIVVGALEAKGSGARFDVERHTWVADPNASFAGKLRFTRVYNQARWQMAVGGPAELDATLTSGQEELASSDNASSSISFSLGVMKAMRKTIP